jgi:glutamate-1-semialdehyde 2,1-aminomutase
MHAGVAGLEEVFTAESADRLFNRGEALRARLNASPRGAAPRCSGPAWAASWRRTSSAAPCADPPTPPPPTPRLRELLFLDMLERGFYLARRGMVALSLEVGAAELDGFATAFADWLDVRGRVLAG